MIKFLKKQFIKLLLYVVIIVVITLSFSHYNLYKNTLLSIISLITSIFIAFMGKTWIDDYKLEIDRELENYKIKLSSYTLVTKLQYDLEFKIYTEIYDKIFSLYIETQKLKPIIDVQNPDIAKRLKEFSILYNETSHLINKYRPFYSQEIYEKLTNTRDRCGQEASDVEASLVCPNQYNFAYAKHKKEEIKKNLEIISNLIKKRIENMKIVEE